MATTVSDLILLYPTNPIGHTGNNTRSDKQWARNYHPIQNLRIHSVVDGNGLTHPDFTRAFIPWGKDDTLRLSAHAVPSNQRTWLFATEADCELWFHSEISNVVLPVWSRYPVVTQTSHTKPPHVNNISEEVDAVYSTTVGDHTTVLAIGEMKRDLIEETLWQLGNISSSEGQKKLSQELRGYAAKYQCPQVYCFDGHTLLVLQFRASNVDDIVDANCPVDCWVLPRESSSIPLCFALYSLLAQGFRRLQGLYAFQPLEVGGLTPPSRLFFDGQPIWRVNGANVVEHPGGYKRSVDLDTGAVKWTHDGDPTEVVWETAAFWNVQG